MTDYTFNLKGFPDAIKASAGSERQDLMNQAIAFYQAGSRCNADFRLSPLLTNSLSAPAAVCYALSVELYFKLLLTIVGVTPRREHRFTKLFAQLPAGIQDEVIKRGGETKEEFLKILELFSDTFEKWRYLHEEKVAFTSISTIAWLGEILHRTVRTMDPQLKVNYENNLVLPEGFKI